MKFHDFVLDLINNTQSNVTTLLNIVYYIDGLRRIMQGYFNNLVDKMEQTNMNFKLKVFFVQT